MIILRRADELKSGDILDSPRRVVLYAIPADPLAPTVSIRTMLLDTPVPTNAPPQPPETLERELEMSVVIPDLTPAQMHAAELFNLLRQSIEQEPPPGWKFAARALLDEIEPPAAPTYDELLDALGAVLADTSNDVPKTHGIRKADDLLKLARRAGILDG